MQGTNAHAVLALIDHSPQALGRVSQTIPWEKRRFWAGPQPCALLTRVLAVTHTAAMYAADLTRPTAAHLRQYAVHRRVLLPAAGFVSLAHDAVSSLLLQRSAAAGDGAIVGAVIPAPLAPFDQGSRTRISTSKVSPQCAHSSGPPGIISEISHHISPMTCATRHRTEFESRLCLQTAGESTVKVFSPNLKTC